jgi:hypothetical protein
MVLNYFARVSAYADLLDVTESSKKMIFPSSLHTILEDMNIHDMNVTCSVLCVTSTRIEGGGESA